MNVVVCVGQPEPEEELDELDEELDDEEELLEEEELDEELLDWACTHKPPDVSQLLVATLTHPGIPNAQQLCLLFGQL